MRERHPTAVDVTCFCSKSTSTLESPSGKTSERATGSRNLGRPTTDADEEDGVESPLIQSRRHLAAEASFDLSIPVSFVMALIGRPVFAARSGSSLEPSRTEVVLVLVNGTRGFIQASHPTSTYLISLSVLRVALLPRAFTSKILVVSESSERVAS